MRVPSKPRTSRDTTARARPARAELNAVSSTAGISVPSGTVALRLAKTPARTRPPDETPPSRQETLVGRPPPPPPEPPVVAAVGAVVVSTTKVGPPRLRGGCGGGWFIGIGCGCG